jgi:hypothetical protein
MTNLELQELLKKYPDDYIVSPYYEDDYFLLLYKTKEDKHSDVFLKLKNVGRIYL